MSLQRDAEPTYEAAVERFKQGKCPACGKGFGQPRGLEYRRGPDDLYCHTCKVSWPLELDTDVLREKLSVSDAQENTRTADIPVVQAPAKTWVSTLE